MPRIRSIHPGQWSDSAFLQCSVEARLLALALRNEADDNGIFEWDEIQIKIRCLPYDDVSVTVLLNELVGKYQLMQFEADGRGWGIIRNFQKFQSPQHPTFTCPVPEKNLGRGYELHPKYCAKHETAPKNAHKSADSNSVTVAISEASHNDHSGEEGRGEERKGEKSISPGPLLPPSGDGDSEAAEDGGSEPEEDTSAVILEIPTKRKGEVYRLTEAKLSEYQETYPHLCVLAECRRAAQWARDNPGRRKTARGTPAFLTNWLNRAQTSTPPGAKHEPEFEYSNPHSPF